MEPITTGFMYLGYFLKPLGYRVRDWHWLIKNFEHRISHWSHKLLSLGGGLTLVQAVLTSIPVYWMGLAPILVSILNKLRSLAFSFLWGSSDHKRRYHLTNWKILSWPKFHGGWGIKYLPWFSIALRLKNLWLVLQNDGLWHCVIFSKYLKRCTVESWLREKNFQSRGASAIWKGLLLTLPWLGRLAMERMSFLVLI